MSETPTGAISTMRLPELKELAQSLGIEVGPKARKADLVEQIRAKRGPARRGRGGEPFALSLVVGRARPAQLGQRRPFGRR